MIETFDGQSKPVLSSLTQTRRAPCRVPCNETLEGTVNGFNLLVYTKQVCISAIGCVLLLLFSSIMALNPAYEAIGKGFVEQYYALFDNPTQRPNLANMYNVSITFAVIYLLKISWISYQFFTVLHYQNVVALRAWRHLSLFTGGANLSPRQKGL